MEIFSTILRTTIATQLQSTPLEHWINLGHQKWSHYKDLDGNIINVDHENEPRKEQPQ